MLCYYYSGLGIREESDHKVAKLNGRREWLGANDDDDGRSTSLPSYGGHFHHHDRIFAGLPSISPAPFPAHI